MSTGRRSQRCGSTPAACSWRAAHRTPTSWCGTWCRRRDSSGCVATTGRCVRALHLQPLMSTSSAACSLSSVQLVVQRLPQYRGVQRPSLDRNIRLPVMLAGHWVGLAGGRRAAGVVREGRLRESVGPRHAALLPDCCWPQVRHVVARVLRFSLESEQRNFEGMPQ